MESKKQNQPRRLGGMFVLKERWGLSWRGWLIGLVLVIGLSVAAVYLLYPFLAVTQKAGGEFLIVEGWVPAYGMQQVVALASTSEYRGIITIGCAVPDQWGGTPTTTFADWGAGKLRKLGVPAERVTAVPCLETQRDRTYQAAAAAKRWFDQQHIALKSIDVVTLGPHARRSRLCTERAFGDVRVGVISLEPRDYDAAHWWRSSEGIREVLGETIGYVHARLFSPRPPPPN